MASETPDPKETKQLTSGDESSKGLMDKVREGTSALKDRAVEEAQGYKDPQDTQLWKSIFRVSHDRSDPRNRSLAILSNVFLHLHPAKINRDAVRYPFTWGMGGITFYLFIVLTFTGVLLMFYYHPTKVDAFRDILYLEHDVPFGKLLRNMHRWAAHLMVITTWLHMFRVVLTGSYKRPREFNWCVGVVLLVLTLLLSFTGYLLPDDQLGFWAVTVGTNMARATPMLGHEIQGFEDEQRIGKELTVEGATPIERLDFALQTKHAEEGMDPLKEVIRPDSKDEKPWYNHKGFFEHKITQPSIYDEGKEKDPKDRLRMPEPFLTPQWRTALTTFLLGSVGSEGANVPSSLFYDPEDQRRQDIQNGWWVVKKYNCQGCHQLQVGQRSVVMDLPFYQTPEGKDLLPPRLSSEGARVDPSWLLKFLHVSSASPSIIASFRSIFAIALYPDGGK